jgi:cytidylate kinase
LYYRAATHLVLEKASKPTDEELTLGLLERHEVVFQAGCQKNRILIDGSEVTHALYTDRIDENVSAVSSHSGVRSWVKKRLSVLEAPLVVEGRDMGSVVFPEADLKFYLTASPEARAARRVCERSADLGFVGDAISRRDLLDARQLRPAEDAVHINTEGRSLDEVVQTLLLHVPVVNKE